MAERSGHAVNAGREGRSERPAAWQGHPRPTENGGNDACPLARLPAPARGRLTGKPGHFRPFAIRLADSSARGTMWGLTFKECS